MATSTPGDQGLPLRNGAQTVLHYPDVDVLDVFTCMRMVFLAAQVELGYPFHRACEKGGKCAKNLESPWKFGNPPLLSGKNRGVPLY